MPMDNWNTSIRMEQVKSNKEILDDILVDIGNLKNSRKLRSSKMNSNIIVAINENIGKSLKSQETALEELKKVRVRTIPITAAPYRMHN